MLPTDNIDLTQEQIEQLEAARRQIPALRAMLRRARLAGIDVSAQETELSETEARLEKLYRVYVRRQGNTGNTTG